MEGLGVTFGGAYQGRRVLITGATGFKGTWLALWALRLGAQVLGLALPPTRPSLYDQAGLDGLIDCHWVDVRDAAHASKTIRNWRPDLIFHLAAQAIVRASYADPVGTFATNALGTAVVLEAACQLGCPVVAVTSDKCYAPQENPAHGTYCYCENDRLGGHDPYSASKGCAELIAAAYRRSFGLKVATARAGNVVGPGDWAPDRIVPDAVRALVGGETVAVRNPASVRPWQHVLEPLAGYLLLGSRLPDAAAEAWNFGPGPQGERRVSELMEALIGAWGTGTWSHAPGDDKKPEAALLTLNIDKAAAHLGWRPAWTFSETMTRTAKGYRLLLTAADAATARKVLEAEIDAYAAAAHARGFLWAI